MVRGSGTVSWEWFSGRTIGLPSVAGGARHSTVPSADAKALQEGKVVIQQVVTIRSDQESVSWRSVS